MAKRISDEELIALVQQKQLDAIKAIEDKAIRKATEKRYATIDAAVRSATLSWIKEFGSMSADPVAGAALNKMISEALSASGAALKGLDKAAMSALSEAVGSAVTTALSQGAAFVEGATGKPAAAKVATPKVDLSAEKKALKAIASDGVKESKRFLDSKIVRRLGLRGILSGLSRARNALNRTASTISTTVNDKVDKTMQATSTANNASMELWIPERDACVRCTKYAGLTVDTGGEFPGGLSWDPKSEKKNQPKVRPSLHPNCRCRLVPWDESWKTPGGVGLPEAVKREAQRSIARGFSLPSESNASRIRALKELLKTNPALPKTVLARAKRDANKGEFARGRSVPTTDT